ncbi:MAG: DinB family protein [Bacillota bacterium]
MKAADFFPLRHEVRAGTLQAVRSLSPEHLEWKPAGGVHSIMGWLRHIAQSEDWWIQAGVMERHDFVPRRKGQLLELDQVLAYLEETRGTTERLLQEWPAEKLSEQVPVPPGFLGAYRGPKLSLHWVMGNLFHHELHHRGQIYLYLRMMGIEPPAY